MCFCLVFFFFSSRRRHTRCSRDWSSDVCSSDLRREEALTPRPPLPTVGEGESGSLSPWERAGVRASYFAIRVSGLTLDRKSTRLNSSHGYISYAVFCLKQKFNDREEAVTVADVS